jgi:molecular chaperone DnaK
MDRALGPTLGLDFGTTNTTAAFVNAVGQIRRVPVADGVYALPSVVHFPENGAPLVGEQARRALSDDPRRTVVDAKRFLGRRFLSGFVGRHGRRYAWKPCEGDGGLVAARVGDEVVGLDDAALQIVLRMVELASGAAGERLTRVVLSCPAYFTHRQRSVLRSVARRAGLHVVAMINEPTAAALRYASTHGGNRLVLVCDLGGGTFDTTLIRVRDGLVAVLANGGDPFLGGTDFDARIARALFTSFEARHKIDLRGDAVVRQRVISAGEQAKIQLSSEEEARVTLPGVTLIDGDYLDLNARLTREKLSKICAPLIDRVVELALETVANAGAEPGDLDEVVLVGGQLKTPALQQRLAEVLPVNRDSQLDPDLAVALGAVDRVASDARLVDSVGVSLFAAREHAQHHEAVPRDAAVPCFRRVSVRRPEPGEPLTLELFEPAGRSGLERDVLGGVFVPGQWLDACPGDLELEVFLDESFELSLTLRTSEGAARRLKLDERSWLEDADGFEAVPTQPPVDERTPLSRAGFVRLLEHEGYEPCTLTELSATSVRLRTDSEWLLGASVELIVPDADRPISVRGELLELYATDSGGADVVIELEPSAPAVQQALENLLRSATVPAPEDAAATAEPAEVAPAPAMSDTLDRFLARVQGGDLYAALDVEPFADADSISRRAAVLGSIVDQAERDDAAFEERADQLRKILRETEDTLLDSRRRLGHDFRVGYVLAVERTARQAEGGIFDLSLCKSVWKDIYPDADKQMKERLTTAAMAEMGGDYAAAITAVREAVALAPFESSLRQREQRILKLSQIRI